jgi:hypothetical protein
MKTTNASPRPHALRLTALGLTALLACSHVSDLRAQPIGPVHVFSEKDDEDNEKCGLPNATLIAAAEAALRYNRIALTDNSTARKSGLFVYVNLGLLEDRPNCIYSLRLEFMDYRKINIPGPDKPLSATVTWCDKTSYGVFGKNVLSARLTETVRRQVDACVSEIERAIR